MVATAQRYSELHTQVEVEWSVRSLQEFADEPLDNLIDKYDLLVIDHPWIGYAAETEILVPLDIHLPNSFLKNQALNSVGKSYESYAWKSHQWALPIDAATPVASSRPDLLQKAGVNLPRTLKDLMQLADQGLAAFPAVPIDTLMNFYMFCSSLGEEPFRNQQQVVSQQVGIQALQILKQLADKVDSACFDRNPIEIYEAMTKDSKIAYCPFAYGYINYARRNYAPVRLQFHDLVTIQGDRLITTLGGTGLAVSARSNHIEMACDYLKYVASPASQQSIYVESGGQPAHGKAWNSAYTNRLCDNFLKNTLPSLDRAFLRPRYSGYLYFQDHAGQYIREYMKDGLHENIVLDKLNQLYRDSLR